MEVRGLRKGLRVLFGIHPAPKKPHWGETIRPPGCGRAFSQGSYLVSTGARTPARGLTGAGTAARPSRFTHLTQHRRTHTGSGPVPACSAPRPSATAPAWSSASASTRARRPLSAHSAPRPPASPPRSSATSESTWRSRTLQPVRPGLHAVRTCRSTSACTWGAALCVPRVLRALQPECLSGGAGCVHTGEKRSAGPVLASDAAPARTGHRPCKCRDCSKRFSTPSHLLQHRMVHSRSGPTNAALRQGLPLLLLGAL